jgi:hypothetical protein
LKTEVGQVEHQEDQLSGRKETRKAANNLAFNRHFKGSQKPNNGLNRDWKRGYGCPELPWAT